MALRFFALIPNANGKVDEIIHRVERATNLDPVFRSNRLIVLSNTNCSPVTLTENQGLIIGHVFTRPPSPSSVNNFIAAESAAIVASQGRSLLDDFWGGYVALFIGGDDQVHVLRDPSGTMPCYFAQTPVGLMVSSDVETLFETGIVTPEIDWDYLAQHLRYSDLPSERTALKHISELLAGFRISRSADGMRVECCWSPWTFASSQSALSSETLVARLHETVSACVSAWGRAFNHVLLGISGGLDSSIVAACLAGTSTAVTCVTLATEEAEGDERHYAQALSDTLGLQLVEAFHGLSEVDLTQPTFTHIPRPGGPAFGQSGIKTKLTLAESQKVDAFFSGIGGDSVFCFTQTATPLLDRFKFEGPTLGCWKTLNDICRLTDCSYWEAIGAVVRKACQPPATAPWPGLAWPWLRTALDPNTEIHPWFKAPKKALPGKIVHVAALTRMQGCLDSFSRRGLAPQIHPLLSQPIVELSLQIPTWEWIGGGRNRSLARKAFDRYFPDVIRRRRSKGGPTHFACQVVESNLPVLRELLMGGLLVQHRIFDPDRILPMLTGAEKIKPPDHIRLSILAEAETWARFWSNWPKSGRRRINGPAQDMQDRAVL
jgi:asparagine synthase (glutamine-hydrolysing)